MNATDATRLARDAYGTRLARSELPPTDDQTRLAQQGYESRLASAADRVQPFGNEFYKIGEKIGDRYEVSAIHHGAMGVVYGCFDHETKLPRALKTVRARYANDKQVLSLFESEAFVWVSLEKHPYIVRAYRVERFNNLPYVITEYVCGPEGMEGDLRGWLGHSRLTLTVAVSMALQIAQGMQHAVRKIPNLVHRDLKPANILVNSEGKAMVTDFGLVLAGSSDAGTPAYMSPEQWRGEDLDMRSDIYAYGCILFEMFTAHRLFAAVTEKDWETAHLENLPVALVSSAHELPLEIDQFLCRCLEKARGARPQTWDEIVIFFAEWYHRLTGKAVIFDFSTLALNSSELFDAGYSLQNINRREQAIQAYDRALAIYPNNSAAWYNKGTALCDLDRHEEAINAFDRALVIDVNMVDAWNNKGNALNDLNRHEESIEAYDRALAIAPYDADTWFNKGNALKNLNCREAAIHAYDQALVIAPNMFEAWVNIGNVLSYLKRYEEAIKAYDRSLLIAPNVFEAWFNKGSALNNLKQYDSANKACDRALLIDPNHFLAWYNKGNVLSDLDRYEDAIKAYDRALAIDPANSGAWFCKGHRLGDLNRHEEAIQAYDRALMIDPNDASSWYNKGNRLGDLNRREEAIEAYDRAIMIDPNDSSSWYNKGIMLGNLNRLEEAINAFDSALAIDPNYSKAWNNKGIVLGILNRHEEAIKAYDRALAVDTTNDFALRARKAAADALKAGK